MTRHLLLGVALGASVIGGGPVHGARPPVSTKIANALAACLEVVPAAPVTQNNLLLLPAKVRSRQSIASCGCKAAAVTYRVTDHKGRQVATGDIWSVARDHATEPFDFVFVLATDVSIRFSYPLELSLGCAAPD